MSNQYPNPDYHQSGQYPPPPLCNQHPMCSALSSIPLQKLMPHLLPAVVAPSPELGSDPVTRKLADDLVMVLTVRKGKRGPGKGTDAYIVAHHLVAAWQVPVEDLWRQALANQRDIKLTVLQLTKTPPAIHTVASSGWTVGGQVFRLEEVLRQALPHGALVNVASDKGMFVWPIGSKREVRNIPYFVDTARKFSKQLGPPLSSNYYWLYQGTLYNLHIIGDGSKINIPIELRDTFIALAEE
jgi:hypothetical protein